MTDNDNNNKAVASVDAPHLAKSESTKNEKLYSKHDLVLQMRIWQELHTTERKLIGDLIVRFLVFVFI